MPPNPNVGDLIATTLRGRSKMVADNFTNSTALFSKLKAKGKVKPFTGGTNIFHEIAYQENSTFKRYSGAESLDIRQSEHLTAAEYALKQASIAVIMTGLERIQNSGEEQMLDLLDERINNAEGTFVNRLAADVYSDGTADNGKQMTGLQALVSKSPATGTVGGISRVNYMFWRNLYDATAPTKLNAEQLLLDMWLKLVRGTDKPDIIIAGNTSYGHLYNAMLERQRFTPAAGKMADDGWDSIKFKGAEIVLDGGHGGSAPDNSFYLLNCDHLFYRPAAKRNMVALSKRMPVNQDASITLLAWCGNMAMNNAFLQGRVGAA